MRTRDPRCWTESEANFSDRGETLVSLLRCWWVLNCYMITTNPKGRIESDASFSVGKTPVCYIWSWVLDFYMITVLVLPCCENVSGANNREPLSRSHVRHEPTSNDHCTTPKFRSCRKIMKVYNLTLVLAIFMLSPGRGDLSSALCRIHTPTNLSHWERGPRSETLPHSIDHLVAHLRSRLFQIFKHSDFSWQCRVEFSCCRNLQRFLVDGVKLLQREMPCPGCVRYWYMSLKATTAEVTSSLSIRINLGGILGILAYLASHLSVQSLVGP